MKSFAILTAITVLALSSANAGEVPQSVQFGAAGQVGSGALAVAQAAFDEAVAVWHFANLDDAAGANSVLRAIGPAQVGVPLSGVDRESSVARGGDGQVAQLGEGFLLAGQGADDELALCGKTVSLYVRMLQPSGPWHSSGIVSKYGGHERLVYNLYVHTNDLGFELGTDRGLFRVTMPLAELAATQWHDIIVRYDGQRLEMWVNGVRVADKVASGAVRQGNSEPLVLGGYSVQMQPQGPCGGLLDTVAIWNLSVTDDQIAALSGGEAAVRKNREQHERQKYAELPAPVAAFRKLIRSQQVEPFSRAARTLREWMLANDPHYPKYHFTGPESWINDPNGPLYYRGRYHLFYQFDPNVDGQRRGMCWGHAVSTDLVHWRDWPVALWPDTPEDRAGVYSGNTFADAEGRLCALYTGNVAGHQQSYGILARSTDEGITWRKQVVLHDNQRPNPDSPVHWDGFTWHEAGQWYQLIGGTTGGANRQGAAFLWLSADLEHWQLQKNIAPSIKLGEFWELPYLIPLGGRHLLLVGCGNPYWIGTYDQTSMTFTPDRSAPLQVDTGHYYSFNLNLEDHRGPGGTSRQLMHGWVTGPPSPTKTVPFWQGAHAIPRVLRLHDNRLWQEPIPELDQLHGKRYRGGELSHVRSDALDIVATFQPGRAKQFGFKLRVSADGSQFIRVFFDAASRRFGVDGPTLVHNATSMRELRAAGQQDSLLPSGEPVTMRILLDRSIVEVFVNGVAYTARAFPSADALGVEVFSESGEATVESCEMHEMQSIWPQVEQADLPKE